MSISTPAFDNADFQPANVAVLRRRKRDTFTVERSLLILLPVGWFIFYSAAVFSEEIPGVTAVAKKVFTARDYRKLDALLARLSVPGGGKAAVEELRKFAAGHEVEIRAALKAPKPEKRRVGVALAVFLPDRERASPWLGELLSNPDPEVDIRRRCAELLRDMADPTAFYPLLDALSDEDPVVRATAIEGLAELADPRANDALSAMLMDGSPEVRAAAARAIKTMHITDALPVIENMLRAETDISALAALQDAADALGGKKKKVTPLPSGMSEKKGSAEEDGKKLLRELIEVGDIFGAAAGELSDPNLEARSQDSPSVSDVRDRQDTATERLENVIKEIEKLAAKRSKQESKKQRYERNRPRPKKGNGKKGKKSSRGKSYRGMKESRAATTAGASGKPGKVSASAADWIGLDKVESEALGEMRVDSVDLRYGKLLRKYIEAIIVQEK